MKTYEDIRGHGPDFIVKYRLYSPDEGGRKVTYQHLRCDFMYQGDDPQHDGVYMIHPQFLDESGQPIAEFTPVPLRGQASMWIVVPEMKDKVHRWRIELGARGHFMEGARKIGDVEVIRIERLHEPAA